MLYYIFYNHSLLLHFKEITLHIQLYVSKPPDPCEMNRYTKHDPLRIYKK